MYRESSTTCLEIKQRPPCVYVEGCGDVEWHTNVSVLMMHRAKTRCSEASAHGHPPPAPSRPSRSPLGPRLHLGVKQQVRRLTGRVHPLAQLLRV